MDLSAKLLNILYKRKRKSFLKKLRTTYNFSMKILFYGNRVRTHHFPNKFKTIHFTFKCVKEPCFEQNFQ